MKIIVFTVASILFLFGCNNLMPFSKDQYIGDYVGYKREGQGTYIFSNGDRYEGKFLNDHFSGYGKLYFSNGDVYEGDFKESKRSGIGFQKFYNGKIYRLSLIHI